MDGVKWGPAQRFEFIEWRLFWTGRVNRSDLEAQFGISTPQASGDFKEYQALAPDNIVYDATDKAYRPAPGFVPQFLTLSADRYLLQASAMLNGAINPGDTWFGSPPPLTVVPRLTRTVEPAILRTLLRAIEGRRAVTIDYRSLTSSRQRSITPHSLAFDGNRWHVRAWCAEKRDFRDFVLARIISADPDTQESDADPNDDIEWNTFVHLVLVADPRLDDAQRGAIERDYGLPEEGIRVTTRAAFAFYVMRHMNLDTAADGLPPSRRPLCLANRKEIEDDVQAARLATEERIRLKTGT